MHRQLGINLGGGDAGLLGRRHQVADLLQKGAVGAHAVRRGRVAHVDRAGVGSVPGIELGLQALTLGQQGDVLRRQISHDGVNTFPEFGRGDAGAGQHLGVDELLQNSGNLQAVPGGTFGHGGVSSQKKLLNSEDVDKLSGGQ